MSMTMRKPTPSADKIQTLADVAKEDSSLFAPEKPNYTKRLSIDVTEETHRKLKMYAAMSGENLADIYRNILDDFLKSKNIPL